jgi:hypothetical protein
VALKGNRVPIRISTKAYFLIDDGLTSWHVALPSVPRARRQPDFLKNNYIDIYHLDLFNALTTLEDGAAVLAGGRARLAHARDCQPKPPNHGARLVRDDDAVVKMGHPAIFNG